MATRVSFQGNVVEVTVMDGVNKECHARKIDADHWEDSEGNVHEYEHGETRADSVASLRRTFRKIRALVNTNCTDVSRVRWITLTYAENMTDEKRLYRDFGNFWKRFKRRWGSSDYISVVEPQGRGAWHVHMLALWKEKAPFVPNDELRKCWGNGFVKVTALDDVDNIGAYLCAYLGDVELPEDGKKEEFLERLTKDSLETTGNITARGIVEKRQRNGKSKKFIKGARLALYPVGMQIYRHSRGVKEPEESWIESPEEWKRVDQALQGAMVVYTCEYSYTDSREYTIIDPKSGQVFNKVGKKHTVRYTQYNLKRKEKAERKTEERRNVDYQQQGQRTIDCEEVSEYGKQDKGPRPVPSERGSGRGTRGAVAGPPEVRGDERDTVLHGVGGTAREPRSNAVGEGSSEKCGVLGLLLRQMDKELSELP